MPVASRATTLVSKCGVIVLLTLFFLLYCIKKQSTPIVISRGLETASQKPIDATVSNHTVHLHTQERISTEEYCKEVNSGQEREKCIELMVSRFGIATAVSSNHYEEVLDMIGSVQRLLPMMPGARLIVYDLGMTVEQSTKISQMCNTELRRFNFSKYPAHVNNKRLTQFAWKPLIVKEMMDEQFEVIMWGDASGRLLSPLQQHLIPYFLEAKLPFVTTSHYTKIPSVQLTHNQTLLYLNMTRERMRGFIEVQATCWVVWITEKTKRLLNAWVDCALHEDCIAPAGAMVWGRGCILNKLGKLDVIEFSGCHRFDQSALNVILVREFGIDIRKTVLPEGEFSWKKSISVFRKASHNYPVKFC